MPRPDAGKRAPGAAPAPSLVGRIHGERGHFTARQRLAGEALFTARARGRARRYSRPLVAAAALLSIAVALAWQWERGHPLAVAVEGGHLGRDGLVTADRASPPVVLFSDGSEVAMGAAATARVRSIDSRGATVTLGEGSVHLDVVHRPESRWTVEAGPFVIHVTGTEFTARWASGAEDLEVSMDRGSIEVSGPLSGGDLVLRSGQRLLVHVRTRETLIRDDVIPPSPDAREAAAAALGVPAVADGRTGESAAIPVPDGGAPSDSRGAPPPLDLLPAEPAPSAGAIARRTIASKRWREALASGHADAVLRDAEAIGADAVLSDASARDLAALADAARYARHDDLARRALVALRRRFPRSAEAGDAAFLLARLDETNGDTTGALALYGEYLSESGNVTYASEALGRQMILVERQYGDDRARPLAEEYVSRFPRGTYADRARALTGAR